MTHIKYPNPNVPKAKFSDEELLVQYNNGLIDREMAEIFKCSKGAVWKRRAKLGLISNCPNGRRCDETDLLNHHKKILRKSTL